MAHIVALSSSHGSFNNCSSSSSPIRTTNASILQIKLLPQRRCRVSHHSQDLSASASFFTSGSSPFVHLQLPCRKARKPLYCSSSPVRASFILTLIGGIIRFFIKVPGKAFLEKIENDVDKLANAIKSGAHIVGEVADEVEEFAEKVKYAAERAEQVANKIIEVTEKVEEEIDEAIEFMEGGNQDSSSIVKTIEDTNVVT